VSIFHNYEVLQHSLNLHCTSTKFMRILLMVWITRLARWNIRVWNKTYPVVPFSSQPYFLDMVGWLFTTVIASWNVYVAAKPTDHSNCWPMSSQKIFKKICALQNMKHELHILFFVMSYFLLFALWWNLMPKILSITHSYCFLTCLYVVAIYMQTDYGIADQCQAKKYLKKICFNRPTYSILLSSGYETWTVYFL
jgi:hypothetical protein